MSVLSKQKAYITLVSADGDLRGLKEWIEREQVDMALCG